MPSRAYIPPPHTKWTKETTKQSCQKAPNPSNQAPAAHPHEYQAEARLEHPQTPAWSPKLREQQAKDLHKSPKLKQQSHLNSECSMRENDEVNVMGTRDAGDSPDRMTHLRNRAKRSKTVANTRAAWTQGDSQARMTKGQKEQGSDRRPCHVESLPRRATTSPREPHESRGAISGAHYCSLTRFK